MIRIFSLYLLSLFIGLNLLFKTNPNQSSILQPTSHVLNTPKELEVNKYFFKDNGKSIKRWKKYVGIQDLNICAQSEEFTTQMPQTWELKRKETSHIFSCSGKAITYSIATNYLKKIKPVLENAGFQFFKFEDLTCVDELKMRSKIYSSFTSGKLSHQGASKMIRMAFHDSIDYGNIMSADKLDGKVDDQAPQGLDCCVHTSLVGSKGNVFDENPDGQGGHNRGLSKAKNFVEKIVRDNPKWSCPDILALASIVATGALFQGPQVPYKLGRSHGDCKRMMCAGKGCKDSQDYFLIEQPHPRKRDPAINLDFFKAAGFTTEEAVALIGAHSVGGVNVCTGNGNPGDKAWCKDAPKLPTHRLTTKQTYFDTTPGKFDNQYFKQLSEYYSDNIPVCNQIAEQSEKKNWKGQIVKQAQQEKFCEEPVCDAGGKIRFTSKYSTGFNNSQKRKVALLPADWVMMKNSEAQDTAREYAEDQQQFYSTFVKAFEKVLNRGPNENELHSCKSVSCQHLGDKFVCERMSFKIGDDGCSPGGETKICQLIGASGLKGVIKCDSGEEFNCAII